MNMSEEKKKVPIGFYLLWIASLAGILIISVVFLYLGLTSLSGGNMGESILNVVMGIAGLGIAAKVGYDMLRTRMSFKEETFEVLSELKCGNCGEKIVREFKEGDFVGAVSEGDKCPKCQQPALIANIYSRTPKGKEKKY
jgi:hypothetical protein